MLGTFNLTRILMSVGLMVFVAAIVVGGTGAFFNDTETSTGNVFTAGALDLKVDSVGHINGLVCYEGAWTSETAVQWNETDEVLEVVGDIDAENAAYNEANPANVPQAGDDCASTWTETDLGPETFFEFGDLKPGDSGENTISLHVYDNDAYACAIIDNMVDADNGQTEPELEDGDDDSDQGELSQELRFFAWADDGDNIWEPGDNEVTLFSNTEGPASDVIDGVVYPLFTPETGVMPATSTQYIGLYWCYGAISTEGNVLSCDGSEVTNLTQTDSLTADFTFYIEQARNNENFECPVLERDPVVEEGQGFSPVDIDGKDWFAKAKLQETNPASDFEVQVGTDDTNNAFFDQGDTEYPSGTPVAFTLVYDAGAGDATFTANGVVTTFNVGNDPIENIGITVRAPSDGTMAVDNLVLSTGVLSDDDISVSNGTSNLTISGANLDSGFTLSGDAIFTFVSQPANGENHKMQISVN